MERTRGERDVDGDGDTVDESEALTRELALLAEKVLDGDVEGVTLPESEADTLLDTLAD